MTPMQAIKAKCLDCCCGQAYEVRACTVVKCPLYPFHLGKNPNIKKREYTEEQLEQMRQRMKKYWEQKENV